ncbi:MAG TPA: chemotaxis protein CheW [Candidatus Acidoferrales bacterium]|nr:chemotaxis protein CheW [Candidatus Acidoferrales bacterium]
MDDIVKDFLIESRENLDRLDQELVHLESDPTSKELLSSIFRTIHTIKGSCGFLGFTHLEKVAHVGENLLSKLRDGALRLNAEITSGLLAMVDAVRRMLDEIQATERDGANDYPELLARLQSLQQPADAANAASVVSIAGASGDPRPPAGIRIVEVPDVPDGDQATGAANSSGLQSASSAAAPADAIPSQFLPSTSKIGGLLVDRGCIAPENLALALQEQERGDRRRLGEILVALGFCRAEDINGAMQILDSRSRNAGGVETVRVGVELLDTLMNLIGELVLARNQLLQVAASTQDSAVQPVSQRMNLIVTEVQEQVMKTRMQPIGNLWNKFPRTVRDLALNCGKEAQLEMEGQDTELDRTILEAIKDPLTHLIRNAVDHGIELPEARKKAGKAPAGRLKLRAYHEGGKVHIEISDDGAGLNVEKLRKKALERGMITPQQASLMAERDIFNLIFLPGFSTAEKVTNVSGRGVGMDVVKTNVERISGAIDIQSTAGKGTTIHVSIPLTLAIVPALIVNCRGERFAIPQISVLELVGLDGASDQKIELVQGAPVYRLRGNLLPLVYLDCELRLATAEMADLSRLSDIVVLQAENRQFGLVVDEILDTEEIVVKPLGSQLKNVEAFSGATIMGDGRVALILDIVGLAQRAKVLAEARQAAHEKRQQAIHSEDASKAQTLLLARHGANGQVAIPLSTVARLEGFPPTVVKRIGDREVMQYRDQIIPLVRLSQALPVSAGMEARNADDAIEVVIYSEGERTVGLIVDGIVDIVEENAMIDRLASRPGVVGSFALQDQITELVDVQAIVAEAVPKRIDESHAAATGR